MVTIHPPARLVGEPKKTKKKKGRKEERHPKQWQTGYSPRPPTSSDQNQTLHGGWAAVCSYTCQVRSKSVKGLRHCGGSKMALSYYFGQWLIQQLVLPYKPWLKEHAWGSLLVNWLHDERDCLHRDDYQFGIKVELLCHQEQCITARLSSTIQTQNFSQVSYRQRSNSTKPSTETKEWSQRRSV